VRGVLEVQLGFVLLRQAGQHAVEDVVVALIRVLKQQQKYNVQIKNEGISARLHMCISDFSFSYYKILALAFTWVQICNLGIIILSDAISSQNI
jgi:hypothetical protein